MPKIRYTITTRGSRTTVIRHAGPGDRRLPRGTWLTYDEYAARQSQQRKSGPEPKRKRSR
jgi:hypothetical protein